MLGLAVAAAVLAAVAYFGFFTVRPNHAVVVLRWGKLDRVVSVPGTYFLFPVGRSLSMVPQHRIVLPATEVVRMQTGDEVRIRALLEYSVSDPKKAVLDVGDLQSYTENHLHDVLRQVGGNCPELPKADQVRDIIQKRLDPAGISVLSMQVDLSVLGAGVRPAAAKAWAEAVIEAHKVLQAAAVAEAKELQGEADGLPKTSRADFLQLSSVRVGDVAACLAQSFQAVAQEQD